MALNFPANLSPRPLILAPSCARLLRRLDADIDCDALTRAQAIEIAEYLYDRLHEILVGQFAHLCRPS